MVALRAGSLLMESGARGAAVQDGTRQIAHGLGAEDIHLRAGYASLAITVSSNVNTITRMMAVGRHGVNQRLVLAVQRLCSEVAKGGASVEDTDRALSALVAATPCRGWGWVALAVGIACASFGSLLGVDNLAFLPVLVAGAAGQSLRRYLWKMGTNGFVAAALVSFAAAMLAGVGARLLGSATVEMAMTAAILLLVPGVPLLNAQTDIMEGHPTLGSARAVSVAVTLVFITVGMWLAQASLGIAWAQASAASGAIWHQALFGALAAAGFGVLFNFDRATLAAAAAIGGLGLAVRTLGLGHGWSLEAASFAAAAAVGAGARLVLRRGDPGSNALAVAGCIPMIPGGAAAKCILGLLALTAPTSPLAAGDLLLTTTENGLRVAFTIGALGAGLTIATELLRRPVR